MTAGRLRAAVDLLVHAAHQRLQRQRAGDQFEEILPAVRPSQSLSSGRAVSSRTLDFSIATWSRVISPELAARCKSSQEATCISRVVSRIDSAA